MKIVAISDVHGKWNGLKIPECDVLISAGDYSFLGESHMIKDFHKWLNKQPAKHIISVQGNHELWVEDNFKEAEKIAKKECPIVHFIEEGEINIDGVKFWCSSVSPKFGNWAYNRARDEASSTVYNISTGTARLYPLIKPHWDLIPLDTDVLVTHGPPKNILDLTNRDKLNVGCNLLLKKIQEVKPILHIFGHIHEVRGIEVIKNGEFYTTYCNASCVDLQYKPYNKGVFVFDLHKAKKGKSVGKD